MASLALFGQAAKIWFLGKLVYLSTQQENNCFESANFKEAVFEIVFQSEWPDQISSSFLSFEFTHSLCSEIEWGVFD